MTLIQLDAVSTVRPAPEVVEAMLPWLSERHALPGSLDARSREAAHALEEARASVASLLGADPRCVVFTSGVVESNNTAIRGAALLARRAGRTCLVVAAHEIPSLLHPARSLAREGLSLVTPNAGRDGRLTPGSLPEGPIALVALSLAHPELGAVQPVADLAFAARSAGALVVVDVSLGPGRLPCDRETLGRPDLLTLDFHRMGGPLGAGALVIPEDSPLPPLLEGGAEERGYRPGPLDLAAIVGAGRAAELALTAPREREARLRRLGRDLAGRLLSVPGVRRAGPDDARRLPGHVSVLVDGVDVEALLLSLEARGVAAAAGSACAETLGLPSAALLACGYSRREARSSIVFCFPPLPEFPAAEVELAASAFEEETRRLRRVAGPMAGAGA